MPKPFLVDRRDPTRKYFYTPLMARNPFLEETNEAPEGVAAVKGAEARAVQNAARLDVDPKAIEQARDGNALMLQSNTGQADAKVKKDIATRAARRKELNSNPAARGLDGMVGALPPPEFELPAATLPE